MDGGHLRLHVCAGLRGEFCDLQHRRLVRRGLISPRRDRYARLKWQDRNRYGLPDDRSDIARRSVRDKTSTEYGF